MSAASGMHLLSLLVTLLLVAHAGVSWLVGWTAIRARSAKPLTALPTAHPHPSRPAPPPRGRGAPPGPPMRTPGPPQPGGMLPYPADDPMRRPNQPARRPGQLAATSGPAAPPGPGRPAVPPTDQTGLYLNILLGVAALLMVTAAIVFVTAASSVVIKAVSLWVVAVLFYATGLILCTLVAKLRPVGIALTAISLAIIPIAGIGLGGWELTSGSLAWFISSLAGVIAYVGAAVALRSQLVTWLSVAFAFSLTMSAAALTPAPVVWYFVVLILTTAPLTLLAVLLRKRLAKKFIRPQIILGDALAPLAVLGALFIQPFPSRLDWGILFAALGVHFLAGALLRRSAVRGVGARLSFALALLLVVNGLAIQELIGLTPFWSRPLTSAAAFLIGAVFVAELGLRGRTGAAANRRSMTASTVVLQLAGGLLLAIGIVFAFSREADGGSILALVIVVTAGVVAVAAGVFTALRADLMLPLGAALAVAAHLGTYSLQQVMLAGPEGARLADRVPGSVAASAAFAWTALLLIAFVGLNSAITSRWGRRLRLLRASMPVFLPAASVLLLANAPVAAHMVDSPLSGIIVVTVVPVLGLGAWWARNALLLVGTLPVALAFGFFIDDTWKALGLESKLASTVGFTCSAIIMATAIAGLSIVQIQLLRGGRRWRARYTIIATSILAGATLAGLLVLPFVYWSATADLPTYLASTALLPLPVVILVLGHWIASALAARQPSPIRGTELRLLPLSVAGAALFCMSSFGIIVNAHNSEALAGIAFIVLAGIAFAHAFMSRIPEAQLFGFFAFYFGLVSLTGLMVTGAALRFLLAAWGVWMAAYALYWVMSVTRDRRPGTRILFAGFSRWSLTPLVAAFIAMLWAFVTTFFVDADASALNSLTMLIAGVTLMMPAFMLVLMAQRIPHRLGRHITAEAATYLGALGGMIALSGIWQLRLVVPLHVLLAATIIWAIIYARSQPAASGAAARFVRVELRTVIPMALISITGVVAAFTADHAGYSLLFLIDHAALLVAGAVLVCGWALWWGLVGVSAGVVWFLRDLMWLALVIIAVFIIGVVIWQLLRKPKDRAPTSPPQGPPPPRPPQGFMPPPGPHRQPGPAGPPPPRRPAPQRPEPQRPAPPPGPGAGSPPPPRERKWQPPQHPPVNGPR
ncbi:hypothetical protein [Brevibacterium otitidis]|uniref:DUF2339 domain-containing protein n=1 Tax=Brevibacterium otitidis TaxID=53364 RepID=A0ABV5WYU0_9MICO